MPGKAKATMPLTKEVRAEIEHIVDARLAGRVERSLERLAEAQTQLTVRVDQLGGRMDQLTVRVDQLGERMDQLTVRVDQLGERMDQLGGRMDQLTVRVDQLGERMDQLGERMDQLTVRVDQLAVKVDTLVEAQTRTEAGLQRMEAAVTRMAEGLTETRNELGGLSRSMSYALENEAFRSIGPVLLERLGVTVTERIVRADVGGEEVNLLARGTKGGREVIVVGETKLRSDPRSYLPDYVARLFGQLERKVQAVRQANPDTPVLKVLLTHYAREEFVEEAAACDITVIQSYEW